MENRFELMGLNFKDTFYSFLCILYVKCKNGVTFKATKNVLKTGVNPKISYRFLSLPQHSWEAIVIGDWGGTPAKIDLGVHSPVARHCAETFSRTADVLVFFLVLGFLISLAVR
jgi:hypothetical protein